ncbi:hypothetical protein CYMTET_22300 [Cymbomonas tetramitiformis]|uniref:Uncharacterized protein n=1 Tax=Cymbomonas tetramitiformis TaxID=36881 RepID=A0AAE0G134_9CHLO|nr:hypothetical protein CYMTET_22300 [Cymbomonas tetramitiformis]
MSSSSEPAPVKRAAPVVLGQYLSSNKKRKFEVPFPDQDSAPRDLRALNTGAKRRRSYSVTDKAEVLQLLQDAESDASVLNKHAKVEAETGVSQSLVSKWGRDRDTSFVTLKLDNGKILRGAGARRGKEHLTPL